MNTLKCGRKDVQEGELRLVATEVEVRESDFDASLLQHLLPSLEWSTLRQAASAVGITSLPETIDDTLRKDEAFLRALHHVLFDVHVIKGQLICVESDHVFPIAEGRPNMMLPESLA